MARKCDDMAQMVERQTVELEVLGLNPATGKFFWAMLQHVTSDSGNIESPRNGRTTEYGPFIWSLMYPLFIPAIYTRFSNFLWSVIWRVDVLIYLIFQDILGNNLELKFVTRNQKLQKR